MASLPSGPGVVVADLDFELLHDQRRKMPVLEHRRTQIYD